MNESEYLKDRLEDQINWYSKKSTQNKRCFFLFNGMASIVAALIPVLFHFKDINPYIPFFGVLITILISFSSLLKFHELWVSYRTTSESLKHHKFLYISKVKPYHLEGRFHTLVENVEAIISKENSTWKHKQKINKEHGK